VARPRIVLHVVTVVAAIVGVTVAVTTSGRASGAARTATVVAPLAATVRASTSVVTTAPASTTTTTSAPAPTATTTPVPSTLPPAAPAATALTFVSGWQPQLVALIDTDAISIYAQPGAKTANVTVESDTWFGTRYVLPVLRLGGDWLQVLLPVGLGNDSTGWIRARDVTLDHVDDSVVVDVAARRLVWVHGGVVQLDVSVAVGAPVSPTPRGSFFVTDVVPEHTPGPYGAWAIATNAVSEAMSEFEGGLPEIAIHGTDDPASIGQAASSGCVRVDATSLERLAHSLPIGTPVVIR